MLAGVALALASPAYLYAALSRPAVVVRLHEVMPPRLDRVLVRVGEAVQWRNESDAERTVEVLNGPGQHDAVLEPGESYEYVFKEAGVYRFGAGPVGPEWLVTVEP